MRAAYEFLIHAIDERQGSHDVDATLARLGTQGWQIASTSMSAKGCLLVVLQRELIDDRIAEPLEEAGALPLTAPNARELERMPTIELPPPDIDAPRARLLRDLAAYRPHDAHEAHMHQRIAAFVAAHADALSRRCAHGHVTASAWIVDHDQTHALLVHHRKLDRWLQPGGHLESHDAGVAEAALREAREETGVHGLRVEPRIFDVDVHSIPARLNEPAHDHYDIRFRLVADRENSLRHNEESLAIRWFALSDLLRDDVDESVRRLARKSRARKITAS